MQQSCSMLWCCMLQSTDSRCPSSNTRTYWNKEKLFPCWRDLFFSAHIPTWTWREGKRREKWTLGDRDPHTGIGSSTAVAAAAVASVLTETWKKSNALNTSDACDVQCCTVSNICQWWQLRRLRNPEEEEEESAKKKKVSRSSMWF